MSLNLIIFLINSFTILTKQEEATIYSCTFDSDTKYQWEQYAGDGGCIFCRQGYASLRSDAYIYNTIPTTGYESVRVETRLFVGSFKPVDSCAIYYRYSTSQAWQVGYRQNIAGWYYNVVFNATGNDNNALFQIKLAAEVQSLSFGDNCIFDKVEIFGTNITKHTNS